MLFTHQNFTEGPLSLNPLDWSFMWTSARLFVSSNKQFVPVNGLNFLSVESLEETQFLLELRESLFKEHLLFMDVSRENCHYPFRKVILRHGESPEWLMNYNASSIAQRVIFFDYLREEVSGTCSHAYKLDILDEKILMSGISSINHLWTMEFKTVSGAIKTFENI